MFLNRGKTKHSLMRSSDFINFTLFSLSSSCLCPASPLTQTMPIYELVRLSTVADRVGARLANLQRGWDEYLQRFDSCNCAPCRHNGIPVLTGTSCKCICMSGYHGEACEETLRTGELSWLKRVEVNKL